MFGGEELWVGGGEILEEKMVRMAVWEVSRRSRKLWREEDDNGTFGPGSPLGHLVRNEVG